MTSSLGMPARQYHRTPLYIAARGGHVEATKLLVKARAVVDARDEVCWQQRSR